MIDRLPIPASSAGDAVPDPAIPTGGSDARQGESRAPDARQIERMWGLLVIAALAFNPPLLRVFGAPETIFGWPLLYVYIFAVWGAVIVLAARLIDRGGR